MLIFFSSNILGGWVLNLFKNDKRKIINQKILVYFMFNAKKKYKVNKHLVLHKFLIKINIGRI